MIQDHRRAQPPPDFLLIRGCRAFALVAALVAAQGCGGGSDTPAVDGGGGGMDATANDSGGGADDTGGSTDGGIVSPRGTGQMVMMPVGAMGATINLEGMRLEIPEGALSASAMLTVTSSTEAPPAGLLTFAPIYRFGPDGTTFEQPITVSFALPTLAPRPRIFWTAPGTNTFEEIGTWLQDGRLYAQVSHFSGGTVVQTPAPTCAAPEQSCMAPCAIPTMPGAMCPVCVDTQTNAAHCGACGMACTAGQTCVAGRCATAVASRLAVGLGHNCAIVDNAVLCWGSNYDGQLGVGNTEPSSACATVRGLTSPVEIAAGANHTCARLMNGTVQCWGGNENGELGDGSMTNRTSPVTFTGLSNVVEIAAGANHTCARLMNGTVQCFGQNSVGQLGDGTTTRRTSLVAVPGLSNVVQIAARLFHTCARLTNGTVQCFGLNSSGQLGDGTITGIDGDPRFLPVAVTGLSNVVEIGTGGAHTCARLMNGTVRCWGYNGNGALGDGSTTRRASSPVAVRCLGGCATGQTACSGACVDTQTSTANCGACGVACATGQACTAGRCEAAPVELAGGAKHTCVIVTGGVQCWGGNTAGQLGVDSERPSLACAPVARLTSAPRSITLGSYHGCALLPDGSVSCWGRNTGGQLGEGTTMSRSSPLLPVMGVAGAVEVVAGNDHSCARLASGAVRCWGRNGQGQLGDGSTMNRLVSVAATGITDAVDIAAGGNHTCARLASGGVRCWGMNNLRQLNDGSITDRSSPVVAMGISNVVDIAAGGFHTCAVQSDGTVRCWGDNRQGQLGDGTTMARTAPVAVTGLSNAVAVSAGFNHTCALLRDGAVRCWGLNFSGQIGDNTTTNRPTPVAALGVTGAVELTTGWDHTCVRLADRSVRCWGGNDEGQVGDGTTVRRAMPGAVACVACPMAQVRCAGACVDTQISAANCGACGRACAMGQSCSAGTCGSTRPMCASGQTDCSPMSTTPTCANTQTSNANCGACGNACGPSRTCNAGMCRRDCTSFCASLAACPSFDAAMCPVDCSSPTALSDACFSCFIARAASCDFAACEMACAP